MTRGNRIRRALLISLAALALLGAAGFAWVWFAPCWLGGCAPLDELTAFQAEGSQLLDVEGEPFGTLATVNRRVVSLDSLPPHLPRAFIAVEDRRFYEHGGLDFRRLAGAVVANVRSGGVAEGGSTITQQLARNLFPEWLPYTQRNLRRKLMEARVARQIERNFSKEKILELYLNHIYLGSGAYGVEAAARAYFGKPAAELSLVEAATLAALPKAPSDLDPTRNPEGAKERRDLVLDRMAEVGYISRAEAEEAQAEPLRLAKGKEGESARDPLGAYFIEQVRRELEERVGSRFYTAGLRIFTTLDVEAQRAAERELARQLDAIEAGRFGAFPHPTYPEASDQVEGTGQTPYLQGAVVLMDAATGEVRALVGGRDFDDSKFNRATQAARQPGSAFKPFIYAAALERFGSPVHPVEDAPVRMVLADGQVWEPKNYTGEYEGRMTLRDALTRSKNSVTVRLAQELGIDEAIETAHELGISSEIPEVPATALGAAEVRPIELVQAYAPFANGGRRVEPHYIRRIEDRHGRVLWEGLPEAEPVLDASVAFVLTSMLRDVVDRGTGTAVRAVGFPGPAAGKTGTTNAATDVWFVGYTPELVGGVWMGLDEPKTIVPGASGGTLAAPVWGRIMRRVYAGRPAPAPWTAPPGVVTAQVERGTGYVVGEMCPVQGPTYTEYFIGSPPTDQQCLPSPQYAGVGWDSMWGDEEWGADLPPLDTGSTLPEGIDWPELEALRRRMRVGEERPRASVAPLDSASPGRPDLLGRPAAPRTRRPAAPERSAPEPEPREAEPSPASAPDLLGTPTRRDTARTATPRDTTGAR